jgi:hypothetical protein
MFSLPRLTACWGYTLDIGQPLSPAERNWLMSFAKQFIRFVVARRKYWLVPVFALLLIIGGLLVFSKGSVVAPLIYTIF